MATSGSVDFSSNARAIVTDAFYLLNSVDRGTTLPGEDLTLGLRVLNRMVKSWQAKGLRLWTYTEGSFATVASTESYVMGTGGSFTTHRPLKIVSMRHVASSIDTPMFPLTRQEYFDLPNKAATGKPTNYYYDPRGGATATGRLYIWPTDSAANSLEFTYQRPIEDFDAATNDADFPVEWEDCLVHNLALRLVPYDVGVPPPGLPETAAMMLDECEGFSREDPGSIFIGVDMQYA